MRILGTINLILAWMLEVFAGIFIPVLLVLSSLMVDTNEGNRLIQIPGFPIVLILLSLAAIGMFVGLLLFTMGKHNKLAGWCMLVSTILFMGGALGIAMCTMHASGAVSQKITGGDRMNTMKLIYRHILPVLIPLFALLAHIFKEKAKSKELLAEVMDEIKDSDPQTITIMKE